jgi:hypothetical protein
MKVTKLKARALDYSSRCLVTVAVENFPDYRNWYSRGKARLSLDKFPDYRNWYSQSKARLSLDKFKVRSRRLHGDNRDRFRRLWGKPSFCWKGEFYFHCWLFNLDNKATALVLTAKGKGTCWEMVTHFGKEVDYNIETVIRFIKQTLSQP